MQKNQLRNCVLFLLLCGIGGTTYAFQKLGLTTGLPLWSAGMRFSIAAMILIGWGIYRKKISYDRQSVITGIQYGVLYFTIPFGIIYWVGQYLPSGLLSVLSSSVAIFSILFHYFLYGQKTSKRQIKGIVLSAAGIVCIFSDSLFSEYRGQMLGYLVISMIAYGGAAYATAMLKSNVSVIVPYTFNTVALLVGGICLCTVSLLLEHGTRVFHGAALFSLLYLAFAGSLLATRITTYLMSQWDVAQVTAYRFISPVVALIIGFIFWGETLSMNEMAGVILIILGIAVINKPGDT